MFLLTIFCSVPRYTFGQNNNGKGGLFGFPVMANLGIGYVNFGGTTFNNVSSGIGIELSGYTRLSSRTEVGGGLSYAVPELNVGSAEGSLSMFGVFANVRYHLLTDKTIQPYLEAHLGGIRQNKKIQTVNFLQRTQIWGEEIEGRAGFAISITPHIKLDIKGGLGLVYFGQSEGVTIQNGQFQSTNISPSLGSTYSLKIGLSYHNR